jgi:undecaprenyl diphosphate synthase
MDGNRRWAQLRSLPSVQGHGEGVKALRNLIKLCPEYKIECLTAYAFSTENWRRSSEELGFLLDLLAKVAVDQLPELLESNTRVSFIGDLSAFTNQKLFLSLMKLEEKTSKNTGLRLQIALNYGTLDEIEKALNKICEQLSYEEIKNLDESLFKQFLYGSDLPDPEILIRTGGEQRLSNFLLWQSANSILHFTETLWPDFSRKDLEIALR